MLDKIEQKGNLFFWRKNHLEVMKVCLKQYKETKNEFYLDMAKWLGNISVSIKKELDNIN